MRDNDHLRQRVIGNRAGWQRRGRPGQDFEHALADLPNIILAFPKIFILDLVELRRQFIDLGQQCPFGVVMPGANDLQRLFGDDGVGEDQCVHIDESGQLAGGIGRQIASHSLQFLVH